MTAILYIIACSVFLSAIAGHIYVKLRLRPGDDPDFDDYYHEFEDQHPGFARYEKWSRITFAAAVVSALVLFVITVAL